MAKDEKGLQAPQIIWDTENRTDYAKKEGHIRDTAIYLTYALIAWMEQTMGGVLTHVKTSTDVATGEVTVAKAAPSEPGAVAVRRFGTHNSAVFSWWRPLKKLNLEVPPDRQFNVTPFTREIAGVGTVFVFPMAQRVSVPRNTRQEEAAPEAAEEAAAAKQPEAPKE